MNGYDLWYETLERVGGAHHLVLLCAPDGDVTGLSEAVWERADPFDQCACRLQNRLAQCGLSGRNVDYQVRRAALDSWAGGSA
jgi:hypothetical protein